MAKANQMRVPRTAQLQQAVRPDQVAKYTPARRPTIWSSLKYIFMVCALGLTLLCGLISYNVANTLSHIFIADNNFIAAEPVAAAEAEPASGTQEEQAASSPVAQSSPVASTAPNPAPGMNPGPVVTPTALPAAGGRITIVLLGIDQRVGEPVTGTRSDTIMLLTLDPATRTAGLLSIPRDLLVTIPGYGPNKINVAHALGGPDLVKKTIEKNFGVKVNYFARINFRGFTRLIDALGGVDINVPKAVHDDQYPLGDTNGVTTVDFVPGLQHMDGARALIYARTRHQDSDFGRIQRQQQVLLAARAKALQGSVLLNWMDILNSLGDTVQTDIPLNQVPQLISLGREIGSDSITARSIDASMVSSDSTLELGEYLVPDWSQIRPIIKELFSGN